MNVLDFKYTYRRLIIFIMVFIISALCIHGQTVNDLSNLNKEKLKKADEYYELQGYRQALDLYLEIVPKAEGDTTLLIRIANSYKMLNDHINAEEWYRKTVVNYEEDISPKYKLYFAQELATNGKYDEALYWFKEYYKSVRNDPRALSGIKSIENLSSLWYDTTFYVVYPTHLNTRYSEFCPTFYKNKIVFLTDSSNSKTGFFSWFISEPDTNGNLTKAETFENHIKTQYNAGPLTFYDHDTKVIYSENYTSEKLNKKEINEIPLQLFSADIGLDDQWTNSTLLPFVRKEYSNTQPSVSEDGMTLYFSSNMPGGFGGADIYISKIRNGTWSDPVNMGPAVNTPGDEMFPFILHDTVLFFSSNGYGGLGGLDILKINLTDKQNRAELMGVPINSSGDDFGIVMSMDGLNGYFSSDRPEGSGSDDLYRFKVIRITFTIKIIDENTALPVSNADIFTHDEKKIGVTDEDGSCTLIIPVSQVFELKIQKDNYESKVYTIEPLKVANKKLEVIKIRANKKLHQENVIYKVQIFAGRKPATKRELKRKYKGDLRIHSFYEDKWYKYSIGEYSSYAEAKEQLIRCNVYDAFIIAYVDNSKVNIVLAKETTNETNIKSPITREDLLVPSGE
jgi:tetratricopeptide (TPR) repeat protein